MLVEDAFLPRPSFRPVFRADESPPLVVPSPLEPFGFFPLAIEVAWRIYM
jgi:hypothetical protein